MPARRRGKTPATVAQGRTAAASPEHHHTVLEPIITMNAGGIIQSASDSVEDVFGWTPAELFGRNVRILIPEPRRTALDRYLDRYRKTDGRQAAERSRRFPAVRKDGTAIQIELTVSRADLPAQTAPHFVGVIRDVTRQIDVGADSPADRTRLQRLITAQTRALAMANLRLQLSDRLASLGTLAAGLGHDMNNVLLPVRARLNALEHAGIAPRARAHVTALRRSVAYLQHLSDGLHYLSIDPEGAGQSEHEQRTTDLTEWWGQVGVLLCRAVPARVKVRAEFPLGLPKVRIAPQWLTQAMLNLLVNAGEAFPPSRLRPRVRVWAVLDGDGRTVRLGVTDNGKGMTAAVRHQAFDLFFTTKSRAMGTGLGLPLVRRVVSRAGGDVALSSRAGAGTTVELTLPVFTGARPGPDAAGRRGLARKRVMLSIADHRQAAQVSQVLMASGFIVHTRDHRTARHADAWVTDPTPEALSFGATWASSDPRRPIVLIGPPSLRTRSRWTGLGAIAINPPDDLESVRLTLTDALLTPPPEPGRRKRP